jgi:hypothetical protein
MFCQRCGKETNTHIMSMFNTDDICTECKDKEIEHPHYKKALFAEIAEIKNGNYNFKGIGWGAI